MGERMKVSQEFLEELLKGNDARMRGFRVPILSLIRQYPGKFNNIEFTIEDAIFDSLSLKYSNLAYFRFENCSFVGCEFTGCSLYNTTFINCDLSNAIFFHVDLNAARFSETCVFSDDIIDYVPPIVPDEGDIIGWKKAQVVCNRWRDDQNEEEVESVIVKLRIPAEAKRSSGFGRKCRAEFAEVLAYETDSENGEPYCLDEDHVVASLFDEGFEYPLGKMIKPFNGFDENRLKSCAPGIHFFITRKEAVEYEY